MNQDAVTHFRTQLASLERTAHSPRRITTLFAGAVTLADEGSMQTTLTMAQTNTVPRTVCYEIVLQSYLFLGFPRMLTAMDILNREWPVEPQMPEHTAVTAEEGKQWYERGIELYRTVYGSNHAALQNRVNRMSPEIFRWMIIEGYGKVLSRPGLSIIDRELAIVAMLMLEAREPQLHSHMRGAINVGATADDLRIVIDDFGKAAGIGREMALRILEKVVA